MKRSTVLGAWFLAFVTTFSTTRASSLPDMADLIIYNAKVLTVNSNFTVASAIAVKDGRILAVGKDRRLEELRGPETRIVDAQGRTIMPGLYDADVNSYAAAVSELSNAMPVINSIEDAQEYIRKQATNSPKGAWIVLNHVYPTRLKEGRLPTKEELDAATTNHPVYWDFGPMAVVNSKALEVSRIDKDTQAPAGGEIVKEPKHSKPTGLLRNASSLLKLPPAAKPPTAAQERAALKHLYQLYNEQGITSIGESDTTPAEIDLFRDMSSSNELTVRVNCARLFKPSADADDSIDRLTVYTNITAGKPAYGPTGVGDDWVRIGPLQTVLDGELNVGTAYLRTPYGIGPTYMNSELAYRGVQKQDSFALPQVFLAAAQSGWQLSTHASGDAALDFVLNCYDQVQFKLDIRGRRFVIAHTDFAAAQDWVRCEKLGLGAVLTPNSLYEDGASLTKTLGTNRLTYFAPLKGWFGTNIVPGVGSGHDTGLDSLKAANPWNPWLGMWITLKRQTKDGGEINPQEKLTREQAIRLYTYNNAWLNFEEKQKGSLEPGKLADLIMVDMDIMKCPVDEIPKAKVLFTMVGGKVVWQAIEPIFPGPQVISAVTVNVPNAPLNVAAPVVPAVVDNQSAAAAAKHAAQATTGINPYAPVIDSAPAPISATSPLAATTTSNAAPAVATTVQPAIATNSAASATTASATAATPATQASEAKPDTTASTEAVSGIAGAAPAEVAANQTPATTSTVTTNQAPSTPATNAVPSATTTNAENSVPVPTQVATATTTTTSTTTATTGSAQDATVAIPVATVSATAQAPAASSTTTTATTTTDASATATPAAPSSATAAPTQVATATTPAPAATASTKPRSLPPLDWLTPPAPAATKSARPDATANATTSPSTTATNDAPASNSQDWSKVSPGTK